MKKILIILFAVISIFLLAGTALALNKTYTVDECHLKITLPKELKIITRKTSKNDPVFKILGTTYNKAMTALSERYIYLSAFDYPVSEIAVTKGEDEQTREIHDLEKYDEAFINNYARLLIKSLDIIKPNTDISSYIIYKHPQAVFIQFHFTGTNDSLSFHALVNSTVINGYALSITYYSYEGAISEAKKKAFLSIVDNVVFTNKEFTPPPTSTPKSLSTPEPTGTLLPGAVINSENSIQSTEVPNKLPESTPEDSNSTNSIDTLGQINQSRSVNESNVLFLLATGIAFCILPLILLSFRKNLMSRKQLNLFNIFNAVFGAAVSNYVLYVLGNVDLGINRYLFSGLSTGVLCGLWAYILHKKYGGYIKNYYQNIVKPEEIMHRLNTIHPKTKKEDASVVADIERLHVIPKDAVPITEQADNAEITPPLTSAPEKAPEGSAEIKVNESDSPAQQNQGHKNDSEEIKTPSETPAVEAPEVSDILDTTRNNFVSEPDRALKTILQKYKNDSPHVCPHCIKPTGTNKFFCPHCGEPLM